MYGSTTSRCSQYARKILLACWLHTHKHARTHARTRARARANTHTHTNRFCTQQHGTLHVCMYTQTQVSYLRFLFNPSFARARQNLSACHLHPFTATDLFPQDNDEAVRVLPLVEFALPQLYRDQGANQLQRFGASMLQTEEALKHLGSCSKEAMRGTQNKLPMDSLTRPFGSPEHGRGASTATLRISPISKRSRMSSSLGHLTVMVFPATRARNL